MKIKAPSRAQRQPGRETISGSHFQAGNSYNGVRGGRHSLGIRAPQCSGRSIHDGTDGRRSRSAFDFFRYVRQLDPALPA
jgi:hypothetical protein